MVRSYTSERYTKELIHMSFNYAPPPPPGKRGRLDDGGMAAKKAKHVALLGDLPTHLPNMVTTPSPPNEQPKELTEDKDSLPEESIASRAPGEPLFIEGTNILLQTEEDIAKWIEERRKNWPTRKNIEAKLSQQHETEQDSKHAPPQKKGQNVCKFFSRNRRCRFGNKCKNLHEASNRPQMNQNANVKTINGIEVAIPQRYKSNADKNKSFFKMLVQKDLYEHENDKVLDFLLYLDSQGMIDHDVNV